MALRCAPAPVASLRGLSFARPQQSAPSTRRCCSVRSGVNTSFNSSSSAGSSALASSARFPVPVALKSARLIWNGLKNRDRGISLSVVAEAAVAVKEDAPVDASVDAPVVTTESVPRPSKIGKGIVRLRLTRLGRKKRPFYRIIATHRSWRRDGRHIELLGHYDPLHAKDDLGIVVKADRIKYWLGVGAQPSDTVTGILYKVGILKKAEGESFY